MSRDLSTIGRALAAPARATFLAVLMDGSTRPAGELARAAGVSAATASEHLGVLLDAGLVDCVPRGRHRFYRIADDSVAAALEQLGHLCPPAPVLTHAQHRGRRDLLRARLCYDHLAGRLGIALTRSLTGRGWLDPADLALRDDGERAMTALGIDVAALRAGRRPLTRSCPDWTERHPHLAGALGAALATHFTGQNWLTRRPGGRGLDVTAAGRRALTGTWGLDLSGLETAPGSLRTAG
ncbi:helix-turn-helix transcriptional regulator [Kineosporia sp. J2-2]|uniref:Helix-turn-helix transcriptional regulator n=1 Tax=Kineosporia corallincola TaxID=2835133 RepID=A0ABS5TQ31_9ACTN|nr:helix-turn-helix transcriptional regulator [Kineosporia corallincola]MBT0773210.1 helix-turn-helix transcriptional regulator [Kineosporia corallincola]